MEDPRMGEWEWLSIWADMCEDIHSQNELPRAACPLLYLSGLVP